MEILNVSGGGEVITVLEVLSPTNKGNGRADYLAKSRLYRSSGVSLIEIDLLRKGEHAVALPLPEIPARKRTPYIVCAARGGRPGNFCVWHMALLERLPAIAVPLRPMDRDAIVDLQSLIDSAYLDGGYANFIDYLKPLKPPLSPEALEMVKEFLRSQQSERA